MTTKQLVCITSWYNDRRTGVYIDDRATNVHVDDRIIWAGGGGGCYKNIATTDSTVALSGHFSMA